MCSDRLHGPPRGLQSCYLESPIKRPDYRSAGLLFITDLLRTSFRVTCYSRFHPWCLSEGVIGLLNRWEDVGIIPRHLVSPQKFCQGGYLHDKYLNSPGADYLLWLFFKFQVHHLTKCPLVSNSDATFAYIHFQIYAHQTTTPSSSGSPCRRQTPL